MGDWLDSDLPQSTEESSGDRLVRVMHDVRGDIKATDTTRVQLHKLMAEQMSGIGAKLDRSNALLERLCWLLAALVAIALWKLVL